MFISAALVSLTLIPALPAPAPAEAVARPADGQGRMYPIRRTGTYHFGKNGRSWNGQAFIGPGPSHHRQSCEVPGPAAYGASGCDQQRVVVRVGQQLITISPWQRIEMPGLHWLERERILWLKAHNYASGVRTFRNDAYSGGDCGDGCGSGCTSGCCAQGAPAAAPQQQTGADAGAEEIVTMRGTPAVTPVRIEPRATIRLPDDAPRFRSKMRVMAPNVNAYVASNDRQGVTTVRGEWTSGTVIKVLPIAKAEAQQTLAKAEEKTKAEVKTVTNGTIKAETKPAAPEKVASAAK